MRALLTLAIMRLASRLPFGTLSRMLGLRSGETPPAVDAATLADAATVGWAVRAVASHAPWQSTCLVQALTGAALLRHRRIDTTLYLGVAQDRGEPEGMAAHAWLRCGDLILTGDAERPQFTPIASFASATRVGGVDAVRSGAYSGARV